MLVLWRLVAFKIPVPFFGTTVLNYQSFSFFLEAMHWNHENIGCTVDSRFPRDSFTFQEHRVVLLFRVYIGQLLFAFPSFHCSTRATYIHIYESIIYGATKHTNCFPFWWWDERRNYTRVIGIRVCSRLQRQAKKHSTNAQYYTTHPILLRSYLVTFFVLGLPPEFSARALDMETERGPVKLFQAGQYLTATKIATTLTTSNTPRSN